MPLFAEWCRRWITGLGSGAIAGRSEGFNGVLGVREKRVLSVRMTVSDRTMSVPTPEHGDRGWPGSPSKTRG